MSLTAMPDEILCAIADQVEHGRDLRALGATCRAMRGAAADVIARRLRRGETVVRTAIGAFVDEWERFSREYDDADWGRQPCYHYWVDEAERKGMLPKRPESVRPGGGGAPHDDDVDQGQYADWSVNGGLPGSCPSYVCDRCADTVARAFDDPLHAKWPMTRVELDAPHVWTASMYGCEPCDYVATPGVVDLRVPAGLAEWIDANAAKHLYVDIITARRLFDASFELTPPSDPSVLLPAERSDDLSGDVDIDGDYGPTSDGGDRDRENTHGDPSDGDAYLDFDDDTSQPRGRWDDPSTDTDDSASDDDITWSHIGTWTTRPQVTARGGSDDNGNDNDGSGGDCADHDSDGRSPPDRSVPLGGNVDDGARCLLDEGSDDDDDYVDAYMSRLCGGTPSGEDGDTVPLYDDVGPHVVVLDERAGAPRQDPFRCFNRDNIHSRLPRYCPGDHAPVALVRIEQVPASLMGNLRAWLPIGRHLVQRHRASIGTISRYVLVCCDPSSPVWGAAVAVKATTYQWPCIVWIPAADDIVAAIAAFRQRYVGPPKGLRSALVRWLCTARRVPGPRAWLKRFGEAVDRGEPVAPLWTGFPRFRHGPPTP